MLPSPRLFAAARVLVGATQQELARRAGIAVTSLRRAEFGSVGVRAHTLKKLMRALVAYGITFEHSEGHEGISIAVSPEDGGQTSDQLGEIVTAKRVRAHPERS